jgi:hypothetical protein
LQVKFPVIAKKIPVPQNIFPVNSGRELRDKWLQHSSFLLRNWPLASQKSKIPCKFPCGHAGLTNLDAELEKLAVDARRAPE